MNMGIGSGINLLYRNEKRAFEHAPGKNFQGWHALSVGQDREISAKRVKREKEAIMSVAIFVQNDTDSTRENTYKCSLCQGGTEDCRLCGGSGIVSYSESQYALPMLPKERFQQYWRLLGLPEGIAGRGMLSASVVLEAVEHAEQLLAISGNGAAEVESGSLFCSEMREIARHAQEIGQRVAWG